MYNTEIATQEGWCIKYDDGTKVGWVQNHEGFPVVFDEERAKVLAEVGPQYKARRVIVSIVEIGE